MFFVFVCSLVLRFALSEGCALFLAFGVLCFCLFVSQPTGSVVFLARPPTNELNLLVGQQRRRVASRASSRSSLPLSRSPQVR